MIHKDCVPQAWAILACLCLTLAGWLIISVYESGAVENMGYATPVRAQDLLRGLSNLNASGMSLALHKKDVGVVLSASAASVVFLATCVHPRSGLRGVVFLLQALWLYYCWKGLLAIPILVVAPFTERYAVDWEVVAEHWPLAVAEALWVVCAVGVGVSSIAGSSFEESSQREGGG